MIHSPLVRALIVIGLGSVLPGAAAVAHEGHQHHQHQHQHDQHQHGVSETQSHETLTPPDIPVTDAEGHTEGFVSLLKERQPLILTFMYTQCESICAVTNAILYSIDQSLAMDDGDPITLVSLSIDPANDTPQALKQSAEDFKASDDWLWLTAGPRGTSPLLDSLGATFDSIEDHDPMFLIGDLCSSTFTRVIGIPEPEALIAMARAVPPCET